MLIGLRLLSTLSISAEKTTVCTSFFIHLMEGWERGLVILKMRNVFLVLNSLNCISSEYISGVGLSQSSMMTEVTVSIHCR